MDQPSSVHVAFPGDDLVLGRWTAEDKGRVARVIVQPIHRDVRSFLSLHGPGAGAFATDLHDHGIEVEVSKATDVVAHATISTTEHGQFAPQIVYERMLGVLPVVNEALVHLEDGCGVLRMDLNGDAYVPDVMERLRREFKAHGHNIPIRENATGRTVQEWRPAMEKLRRALGK